MFCDNQHSIYNVITIKAQYQFLKNLISHTHWGIKLPIGVRPVNTAEKLMSFYNERKHFPKNFKRTDYIQHINNEATYYFQGNQSAKAPQTLAGIDIDCHKIGTIEGATNCAAFLKTNYFPFLNYEVSTNFVGIHAFFICNKQGLGPKFINDAYKNFEEWLQQFVPMFDISGIEIKGHIPQFTWQNHYVTDIKAGSYLKMPRGDFRQTQVINAMDLAKLQPAQIKVTKSRGGSQIKVPFATDEIPELLTLAKNRSYYCMAQRKSNPSGRAKLNVMDFQQALVLLSLLPRNEDDGQPQVRIAAIWTELYKTGLFKKCWDDKKWKVIRDTLSELGFIIEVDSRYFFYKDNRKGKAMQWYLHPDYVLTTEHTHTSIQTHNYTPFYPILINPLNWYEEEALKIISDAHIGYGELCNNSG